MIKDPTYYCRVCGFFQSIPQYGEEGDDPTYNICVCCGVEFGYGDMTPEAARSWRDKWHKGGAHWRDPALMPARWDVQSQLLQVPEKFK